MNSILIVDDYEEWRRQISLLFQVRPELQVIGEASNGLEAVQRAEELKPDLVLLDIGLPKLNGIEAARQIQQLLPHSKIIFLSHDNSLDAVQASLNAGAYGYVHKAHAGNELLAAVEAVLLGKRYVSGRLRNFEFSEEHRDRSRHVIVYFSDDSCLVDIFTRAVASALNTGNAAIVLATASHRESLLQRLETIGVDVGYAMQQGTYHAIDVAEAISAIMVNDLPDPVRFFRSISSFIEAATKAAKSGQPRVVVCGEGVAHLQAEGKPAAAIRLEQLCDELANTHEVNVLCAYPG